MKPLVIGAFLAVPIMFASNVSADVDTDFTTQMQAVGIYGQKDYNAWLAKITCERLTTGVDTDARASAEFLSENVEANTDQIWQFLAAGLRAYCPQELVKLS